jgi:hypothetical protein
MRNISYRNKDSREINDFSKVTHAYKLVVDKVSNIANFNFQLKEKTC